MSDLYQTRLQLLAATEHHTLLKNIQRGIEKEGLRVTGQARVAQTAHPLALGSALTHNSITTDYSEALLEFITPVSTQVDETIDYLQQLHCYALRNIGNEYIWPTSMPCRLQGDESIPIAQYGSSNIGQLKTVYRRGLGHRYGRIMQSIAGIHYNFSLPESFWPVCQQLWQQQTGNSACNEQDYRSERYFALIRNFRRHSWILSYLFGASPVLDNSFVNGKPHQLDSFGVNTLGLPYATSLRMSDIGYKNKAQSSLNVSYNNLCAYIDTLRDALKQSHPEYEKIGVKKDGEYRQLNSNILQIENEYYSDIRPKRVIRSGEKAINALCERGVEYIEVRILDINPYLPVGIDAQQIRFLDAFLLYCMLSDSDQLTAEESEELSRNHQKIILQGRKPSLMLTQNGKPIAFSQAAGQLLDSIKETAKLLDDAHGQTPDDPHSYFQTVVNQSKKISNSELTPSGQMMNQIKQGKRFTDLMLAQAKKQKEDSLHQLPNSMAESLTRQAEQSLQKQQQIEASDQISFDAFLKAYQSKQLHSSDNGFT